MGRAHPEKEQRAPSPHGLAALLAPVQELPWGPKSLPSVSVAGRGREGHPVWGQTPSRSQTTTPVIRVCVPEVLVTLRAAVQHAGGLWPGRAENAQ